MPKTNTTATPPTTHILHQWRQDRITDLGYTPEIAEALALAELDWHLLERLVRLGCPPDLAIRILA